VSHASYGAGFQFEVPLGNREARAIFRRSVLQRQQAIDQYRALTQQVALDVKQALNAVYASWDLMIATRKAVFAAADALRAIQQREESERLTPEFVQLKLDQQQRLAESERSAAEAVANYNIAIARLERAKGTLLRYNNIMLEEDPYKRQWVK
jgi:outer membrane protein TolC